MDLTEWNHVYNDAIKELERRLAKECRLIPPNKIPQVIRAVQKQGMVSTVPSHSHDPDQPDGTVEEIVLTHTVYEKYKVPFLEFKALIRGTDFVFEINPIPKEEAEDGTQEEQQDGEQGDS